jgi:hypothetical protein
MRSEPMQLPFGHCSNCSAPSSEKEGKVQSVNEAVPVQIGKAR